MKVWKILLPCRKVQNNEEKYYSISTIINCRSGRIANEPWNGSEPIGPIFRTKETTIDIAFFLFLFIRASTHGKKENILRKLPNSNQDWSNIKRVSLDLILYIRLINLLPEFQGIQGTFFTLVIIYYLASDGQECQKTCFVLALKEALSHINLASLGPSWPLWPLFDMGQTSFFSFLTKMLMDA